MISVKSSRLRFLSLIAHLVFRRQPGTMLDGSETLWVDFFFPFTLFLIPEKRQLEVAKRNWFGVGMDKKVFNFGQIRNVLVDEHVITASIKIKVYAGVIEAHWLRKAEARAFQNYLMDVRSGKSEEAGIFLEN